MCFSQNDERLTQRIIPEMFRRWIIRTILLPLKIARKGLEIFEIRDFILYPFQDLNLLSGRGNADYILPLMVAIVNLPSTKISRISKP